MDVQTMPIPPNISASYPSTLRFISEEAYSLAIVIKYGIITTAISLIGIFANCVNIAVFVKVGFRETIDVSLTALSISDTIGLLMLLGIALGRGYDFFCDAECRVVEIVQVEYLTGGLPRAYSTIVSGLITSIVAGERCLCVLKPLKVKTLLTKKKLLVVLGVVFVVPMLPFVLICYTTGVGWVFDPKRNRSILTLTFRENGHKLDLICYTTITALYVVTYVSVSVSTGIIVWRLASQSSWRAGKTKATNTPSKHVSDVPTLDPDDEKRADAKKSLSGKDRRATQTVTMIAAIYIVCYFPGALIPMLMAALPDFNKGQLYDEFYIMTWAVVYIIEGISASANILVYLKTSTRYKEAFVTLFCTKVSTSKK